VLVGVGVGVGQIPPGKYVLIQVSQSSIRSTNLAVSKTISTRPYVNIVQAENPSVLI
jgi:hypothetical protein